MVAKNGERRSEDIHNLISNFNNLPNEDKIILITHFIDELKKIGAGIGSTSIHSKELSLPLGIFDNDVLSSLEAIVKYLKEEQKIRFSKIAKLLNRSSKTIWATYHKSIKKMPASFSISATKIFIPVSAFSNREFSILESLVGFIKDLDYSNHEVGIMLHLDDRTIWTVYDRVKKKRGLKT